MTHQNNKEISYIDVAVTIRQYLLLLSKLLGLSICTYFILQAKSYEISWNLLNWLMPTVAFKINSGLSYLGMYILIIPLSIIILSLIITNNLTLNIIASFFGISGTLFTVASGLFNNTLSQVYNMKFLVITYKMLIEEKRAIFIAEYQRIMNEKFTSSLELYNLLKEHLEPKLSIVLSKVLHK